MQRSRKPSPLRARSGFLRVQAQGRRYRGDRLVVLVAPNALGGAPRVGYTVSRKVGNAVVRNLVRRRLREIVRAHKQSLLEHFDYVVIAYPAAAGATFSELRGELTCLFDKARGQASRPRS